MAYNVKPQAIYDGDTSSWVVVKPCISELREIRNKLLSGSDWTQAADSPLSNSKKTEWATYRQALRDLPAGNTSETDLTKVDFPDIPT